MVLIGYLASVLMGLSLGLLGGGGSILTVPILYYFFKQDSLLATTNSLFVVGITALVGAVIHAKKGSIEVKTGILFAVPSFAGVFVARHLILPNLPQTLFAAFGITLTKPLLVMLTFAALMVMAARAMIRSGNAELRNKNESERRTQLLPEIGISKMRSASPSTVGVESNTMRMSTIQYINIGFKGFLVGCTTGFVGAGGGFLIIPALVILLNLPIRLAIGTSLAIIAANSLFGFGISYSLSESTDWQLLLTVCGLGVVGIFFGQKLSSRIHDRHLKSGFGYFVLIVGSFILLDQIAKML